MPIRYWINELGLSQIPNASEFQAVHAGFQTWQNVASANISFSFQGTTPVSAVGRDGVNLVTFQDETTPLGSSTLAVTLSFFEIQGSDLVTVEADILFNSIQSWSTSGESGKVDVQGVLTHEAGHVLGLDHSGLLSSVMVPFMRSQQIDTRVLQFDDIAGVSEIYPGEVPPVGEIRGFVKSGGAPVFGAHVVAVDAAGTTLVSTLSLQNGDYVLRFLPSGSYRVYAEPLDQPVTDANIGGLFTGIRTDFGATFLGNVSTFSDAQAALVAAGETTNVADILVLPPSATGLNLSVAATIDPVPPTPAMAPRISVGTSVRVRVGGNDIVGGSGLAFSTSSPPSDISLGAPTFGGALIPPAPTSAALDLSISANTPPGPKAIGLNRGTNAAVLSGGIVATAASPSVAAVNPSAGPPEGQVRVTVTGNNFREGARVYFGGLPADDVQVLGPQTIEASAPQNVPGSVNVQVVNADGTNGIRASGFLYSSSPPSIASVTPLTGPSTTLVEIQGTLFDRRPQATTVSFNGLAAQVVSVTMTRIQVIVPFGASSGPIRVSAFGQTVTGPVFTVTPMPPSSNLAPPTPEFQDVSPGGAALSFPSPDDGAASIPLPFTFALFREVFLPETRLFVTTNGWVSLRPVGVPAFENGRLASTTMPQALLAPFFDDLTMVPNASSVSWRVTGDAPNRKLIIQWSKMNILDEEGNDLNASLTFQMVLFEGSFDIQFVYGPMSGVRADGSSATVGIQNLSRSEAIETGFNHSFLAGGRFVTYSFRDGRYAFPAPFVEDGGARTNNTSQLSASWTSPAGATFTVYEYAIGTAPGLSDVRSFVHTTNNSVVVNQLTLEPQRTYFFTVRALNPPTGMVGAGVGVSDGITVDPSFQTHKTIVPALDRAAPRGLFSGIGLLARSATTAVLTMISSDGTPLAAAGLRNPRTISLGAGQHYARLIPELFGIDPPTSGGWIEIEASSADLGVYVGEGRLDRRSLDGFTARTPAGNFIVMHPGPTGGTQVDMINPSSRPASVTITQMSGVAINFRTIPPRGALRENVPGFSRVDSSEPLVAIERQQAAGPSFAYAWPQPVSSAGSNLTIPYGITGAGWSTTLTLVNIGSAALSATVRFSGRTQTLTMQANSSQAIALREFLQFSTQEIRTGAIHVTGSEPTLLAAARVENGASMVFFEPGRFDTDFYFPMAAHGAQQYTTGLSLAAGDQGASVTIEVHHPSGGPPKTNTLTLGPNEEIDRVIDQFVPNVGAQLGGYVRVRSDRPIWALQIIENDDDSAVAPVPAL